MIQCPQASADGSLDGIGTATFNVPKDARNVSTTIRDASTGEVYDEDNPVCGGTTMTVTQNRVPGTDHDTVTVTYRIHNAGTGNPTEQHSVTVDADWDRTSDIGIEKHAVGGGDTFGTDEVVTWSIRIHNYGPAPTDVSMLDNFINQQAGNRVKVTSAEQVDGPAASEPVRIQDNPGIVPNVRGTWKQLKPGDEVVVAIKAMAPSAGDYVNEAFGVIAQLRRAQPNPDPHPGLVHVPFMAKPVPDSQIGEAGSQGTSGSTTAAQVMRRARVARRAAGGGATHVQVAILHLTAGVKPLTGQMPASPTRKPGRCEWVASKRGTTVRRKADHGVCDSPVWLKATGTKHWSLKLSRMLPPGRYAFYSRAVGAKGLGETNFTNKDGNRRVVRIH